MAEHDFDVIVIGSGPGGYVAAVRAAQLGLKVACVDKRPTLGGTCLNVGCIPSKALLQSTEHYAWLKNASKEHGITATNVAIDFGAMMQRKEGIVRGLVDGINTLFKKHHIVHLQGNAHFTGPHSLEVVNGSERQAVHAANIIIATGSEPIALPFLPFDEKRVVSSTGALSLTSVPKRFAVIGGGVIGVELASVYRRLGSEVVVVEMLDTLTPMMDPAISKQLLQVLKKQGLEFYLGAKVTSANVGSKGVQLFIEHDQKQVTIDADVVLVAVGRRPYTQGLGLDVLTVVPNAQGLIPVDVNFRNVHRHIYAIGDVIEGPMLAHRASHEGMAVAELIAGHHPHVNYASIPNVIYTHPEVASVGFTEPEARNAGLNIVVGTSFFRGNPRSRCSGDTEGLVKVIGEVNTGRLIGMHIIGAQASELIAEGMMALEKKATLSEIANTCHAHPTLAESIMEACQQALGR